MDIDKLTYEEGMKLLQEILDDLENEDMKLDETVDKFKKAMKIYDHCNEILTKAEGEVKIILNKEMSLEEVDFLDNLTEGIDE